MILYSISSTSQSNSGAGNNIDVRSVRQIKKDSSNTGSFQTIAAILQQFHIGITFEQIGFFLTCQSIWHDFISRQTRYCLIAKDPLPGKELQRLISDNHFPPELEILFPFDKMTYGSKVRKNEQFVESMEKRNGFSILLELLIFDSMYVLSRSGAFKLLNVACILNPANTNISMQAPDNEITACYFDTGWIGSSLAHSLAEKRNKNLKTLMSNSTSWTPETKKMAKDILKNIYQTGLDNGIDIILHGGSLLGYVRHGGIMPWDDDIDLGINEDLLEVFLRRIRKIEHLKITKLKEEWSGIYFYKIWATTGTPIAGYPYTFPFVDIWLYKVQGDHILFHNGKTFPNALKAPFKEVNFEGSDYKIPSNYQDCLDSMYSDWRRRIKVFTWSHRLEKSANPPIEMSIMVDANGRIIE